MRQPFTESAAALSYEEQDARYISPPAAGVGSTQPYSHIDTGLINRLAAEVAQADVVSAWEEVEALRRQLRRKDDDLHSALAEIEHLQHEVHLAGGTLLPTQALGARPASAGQQLAQFLKEQLAQRDEEVLSASRQIATLQQQVLAKAGELTAAQGQCQVLARQAAQAEDGLAQAREQLAAVEQACAALQREVLAVQAYADQQAEAANLAKLELAEVQQAAQRKVEQLQQELHAAEAQLQAARSHGATPGTENQPQQSISLRSQPATVFHSPPCSPVSDIFGSPQPAIPEAGPAAAAAAPGCVRNGAGSTDSASFQFQPLLGRQLDNAGAPEEEFDRASSSGETDDTVSEAALVARTMRRAGARSRRDDLQEELSRGLQQVKEAGSQVHALLAWEGLEDQHVQHPAEKQHQHPGRVHAREKSPLEEQCHFQQLEERQLRAEIATLTSKCEHSNQMLLKANQAMKILHFKLQKERKTVARLQDEKCQLQSRLLQAKATGASQINAEYEQEVQQCRTRIQELLEQKVTLEARVDTLPAEQTYGANEQQRQAELEAQLQALQAAGAANAAELDQLSGVAHSSTEELMAAREELQRERMRTEGLVQERAELRGKAEATAAEATLAQQAAYVKELEQVCQSLRQQLDAALTQHVAAQSAVEGAADRMQLLAEEKRNLEQRLQQSQEACAAAQASAGQAAAEQSAEVAQQRAEAATLVADLQRQLASLAAERDQLAGEVHQLAGQKAELQDLVQALQAECDALRRLGLKTSAGSAQDGSSCDMTGLIEAVQALQHRNSLLHQDLDRAQAQLSAQQAALDSKSQQHSQLLVELKQCRSQLAESQGAAARTAQELGDVRKERAALLEVQAELEGKLGAAEAQAQLALQELQEQLRHAQASLSQLAEEQQGWQAERKDLQGQLATARKAQALAQSKLVLAKQRETQLREASEQFVDLQGDLRRYLEECETVKEAKQQADNRCRALEEKVAMLEQQDRLLSEQLTAAQGEGLKVKEANLLLREQLARLELSHSQLQQQHAAAQSLQQRLSALESEQQSSSEWFDALNAELADKAAEIGRLQSELAVAAKHGAEVAEQREQAQQALTGAQQAQADAEAGWRAASAALQETESKLAHAQQQCEVLERREEEATRELAVARATRQRAERRTGELEVQHEQLQAECAQLRQQLEVACSTSDTALTELRQQAAHLGREREQLSAQLQEATAAHQQQLALMQATVDECLSSCDQLAAELGAATAARQEAAERADREAEQAQQLQGRLSDAEAARDALQAQQADLEARAAQHARCWEQLQQECAQLTQHREELTRQLTAKQAEYEAMSAALQTAQAALADAQAQRRQLNEQLEATIEARHAAQQAAADALAAERAAREEVGRKAGELEALQRQLEEAKQAQQEHKQRRGADIEALAERLAAAEQQLQLSHSRDDVKAMLQDVSHKLEAQMEVLQRVGQVASSRITAVASEDHSAASPMAGTPKAGGSGLEFSSTPQAQALARRELLVQALEKLETLQAENQQLWRMVEAQLRPAGSVPLMHADQGELASKLAAAEATIAHLEHQVKQLSTAAAAAHQAQHSSLLPAGPTSSSIASQGTCVDHEAWQVEKRVLKAICKLALAVTMDQVGGRHEAAALAEELAATMEGHEPILQQLGLFQVWRSLHKLAASVRPSSNPQGAAAAAAEATTLRERAEHYESKCRELQRRLAEVEAATTKWQGQADDVEQALALLRFQLEDLLAEVQWVLGDLANDEDGAGRLSDWPSQQQLGHVVGSLSKAIKRLLRKYRSLSSLLAHSESSGGSADHSREEPLRRQQQQQHVTAPRTARGGNEMHGRQQENLGLAANSMPQRGAPVAAASAPEELVAQVRGKAASIAQKLDRLLTPHSRAAVHKGNGGGSSRFVGSTQQRLTTHVSAAGQVEDRELTGRPLVAGLEGGQKGFQGSSGAGLFMDTQFEHADDQDIPLRQRYGRDTFH
ncbi:hypothetical protein N2152v2_010342 [Parachlorella kessleri]